jgi:hypothetical protein
MSTRAHLEKWEQKLGIKEKLKIEYHHIDEVDVDEVYQ